MSIDRFICYLYTEVIRHLRKEMTEENNSIDNAQESQQQVQNENKDVPLRAFFVSVARNQEEAAQIQQAQAEGHNVAMAFIPVYAESEYAAHQYLMEAHKQNGMVVMGIDNLETLEMKVFLLRNIAQVNDIEIKREKMFDGRLLMTNYSPVKAYDGVAVEEDVSETSEEVVDAVVSQPELTPAKEQ